MIGMELNSHSASDFVCAKRVIVQHADVKFRSNLRNLNPHALDVSLVTELYPKYQLDKIAGLQVLTAFLRRNPERIWKLSVNCCAVIKSVSNRHGMNVVYRVKLNHHRFAT
jgi:hypothetical protein